MSKENDTVCAIRKPGGRARPAPARRSGAVVELHVGEPGVRGHHALGPPGRAGGVDRVRGVAAGGAGRPARTSRTARPPAAGGPARSASPVSRGETALTVRITSGRASATIAAIRSSGWSSSSGTYAAPARSTANSATTESSERGSASAHDRLGADAALGEHPRDRATAVPELGERHGPAVRRRARPRCGLRSAARSNRSTTVSVPTSVRSPGSGSGPSAAQRADRPGSSAARSSSTRR